MEPARSRLRLKGMKKLFNGMRVGPGQTLLPTRPNDHTLHQITSRFSIPLGCVRPYELAQSDSRHHPRGYTYKVPAAYRAAAFGIENPACTVLGFGALALYGLPFCVEGKDTVLMNPNCRKHVPGNVFQPSIVRRGCPPDAIWDVTHAGWPLRVASPAAALVQALSSVYRGQASWSVMAIDGWDNRTIRAIQLVDAARRFLGIHPDDIIATGKNILRKPWLAKVVGASSQLADSPKETEMRLSALGVCAKYGLELKEQVVIRQDGQIISRFDLAIPELNVGLMFDGAHHAEPEQMHKDHQINLDLQHEAWLVLRFSNQSLPELPRYLERQIQLRLRALGLLPMDEC